jgi:dipeptidyl aminopeptidase/acylaminoacyl peptidase
MRPTPDGKAKSEFTKTKPMNFHSPFRSCYALCLAAVCASCSTTEKKPVVVLTTGAARNVTRLTQTPQDETNPAVSPDGKTVAFQVSKGSQ